MTIMQRLEEIELKAMELTNLIVQTKEEVYKDHDCPLIHEVESGCTHPSHHNDPEPLDSEPQE